MRVLLLALGLMVLPLVAKAQPVPGNVTAGSAGQSAVYIGVHTIGPGTGTNSASVGTNTVILQYVTYDIVNNQWVTNQYVNISFITNFFGNKATINNLFVGGQYFSTNAFPGPSGAFDFTNSFQYYRASANVTVTALNSVSNNLVNLGMLMVSNITGSPITLTVSVPNVIPVGVQTASPMTIAANSKGWVKFLAYGNVFTNYACDTDAGSLATQTYVNTATNGFATTAYVKTYTMQTNNPGGAALVFGGGTTAATLYDTNITAATTLKLFDITQTPSTGSSIKLYVTCTGGTDRILTFPAGCSGAGLSTPPAVTITNAKGAFFDVIYKPGATPVTNVFWSPVY